MGEAGRLEAGRLRGRIVVEDGGALHLARDEADAGAGFEIDGGVNDERHEQTNRQGAKALPHDWGRVGMGLTSP